jgi:uncharacterized protein (TIGR02597 family)
MNTMNFALGLKKLALACSLALIASPAFAQTTATTDPVGFTTINVAGTSTSPSGITFASLGLTRTVAYQGSAETAGLNSITDNEATWTDSQFNGAAGSYYIEITSGSGAGQMYDITATTAATKTLTLSQNLAAGISAPISFKVRQHWTFASVFGATNEGGLAGGTITQADQIFLYSGSGYETYYYSTGGIPGIGWRKVGTNPANTSQANTPIYPEDGIIIKRKASATANIVIMGGVKTGQSSFAVVSGSNIVSNIYASAQTLASSSLYTNSTTTGIAAGTITTADQVFIWNTNTQGYDTYYYSTGGIPGQGWRKVGSNPASTDQSSVLIPVNSAIIINRKNQTPFNWVSPQHPATL